jgi:hypothetical protein
MPKVRTKESCMRELREKLPQWNGDTEYLVRILDEMDRDDPGHDYQVRAFKQYWGLIEGRNPLSAEQIAARRNMVRFAIHKQCAAVLQRLKDPKWWGEKYKHLRDP